MSVVISKRGENIGIEETCGTWYFAGDNQCCEK